MTTSEAQRLARRYQRAKFESRYDVLHEAYCLAGDQGLRSVVKFLGLDEDTEQSVIINCRTHRKNRKRSKRGLRPLAILPPPLTPEDQRSTGRVGMADDIHREAVRVCGHHGGEDRYHRRDTSTAGKMSGEKEKQNGNPGPNRCQRYDPA